MCEIKGKICFVIIGSASGAIVVSSYLVKKLELTMHQTHFLKSNNGWMVLMTLYWLSNAFLSPLWDIMIMFFCDVIPMQYCHIMLGRPWQFNRNATHDRRENRVSLELNRRKYALTLLTPSQDYEDHKRFEETMKFFERRMKGVREYMLTSQERKNESICCMKRMWCQV